MEEKGFCYGRLCRKTPVSANPPRTARRIFNLYRIVPLTILRLIYITSTSKSADHTWDEFDAVATTQIIVNLSVVVACIPFLKPFLDSLQTGAISGNIRLKPLSDNSAAKKAANSLRSRKDNAGNGASFHFGSQHNWMVSSITRELQVIATAF